MRRCLLYIIALIAFASQTLAGVFDVAGKPADKMTAYLPGKEPNATATKPQAWDLWLSHALENSELTKLRSSASANKRVALPESAEVTYVLVCEREKSQTYVELLRDDAGRFFARSRDDTSDSAKDTKQSGKVIALDSDKVANITYSWPKCRAEIKPPTSPPPQAAAKTLKLDILIPGWFRVDQENLENRFVHGRDTQNPGSVRILKDARAVVRLPKNYNPSLASGLVVFIHAMPDAVVPESVNTICDELGFLCVAAADVGNQVPIADRLQRSLDAVATVQQHYLIDQSRVYATGISGGGKLSVHAWLGYPEVFRGAVPCVGMSAYENLKRADGKYYRGDFPKPNASKIASLKDHRVAAVTGDKDFNYEHIKLSVKLYQRDKFDIKLFDVPGMDHEFAPQATFTEALQWVDEPWRNASEKATTRITEFTQQHAQKPSEVPMKELQDVLETAPFSSQAWNALQVFSAQLKR